MLRRLCILIPTLALVGCASNKCAQPVESQSRPVAIAAPEDDAVVASALVFDPPTSSESALLDLSRAPRQPAAFVGYEDHTTTFYYLQLDNHQQAGRGDLGRYDRHEFISRFGSSTR